MVLLKFAMKMNFDCMISLGKIIECNLGLREGLRRYPFFLKKETSIELDLEKKIKPKA
jgi:hypothetical protein